MPLLVLTAALVAMLIPSPTLRPIPIAAGPEAGQYAVSPNVLADPAQAQNWAVLQQGQVETIDPVAAWPSDD